VSPTTHGAVLRVSFPPLATGALASGWNQTRRVLLSVDNSLGAGVALPGASPVDGLPSLTAVSTMNSGGVPLGFGQYYHMTVGGGADGTTPVAPFSTGVVNSNGENWAYMDFDPSNPATASLTLRVGTSLISPAQAADNYRMEVAGQSFDGVKAAAKAAWHTVLSRANVTSWGAGYIPQGEADQYTMFYSALYRASMFPRRLTEFNATTGAAMHWSAYDGQVHAGEMSTDQVSGGRGWEGVAY
jgi:hypothetical protein